MSEIKDKESWHGHTNAEVENYIKNRLDNSAGCKKILYAELKELRDNGKLIPGMQYRITDYQCTTTQENTKSAGHQFDIIVTADSENVLNEEARAIQHEGDEYFANSNLSAWKIWYCLDNDTVKFAWAQKNGIKSPDAIFYRAEDRDEINNGIKYYAWIAFYQEAEHITFTLSLNPKVGDITYDDTFIENWNIIDILPDGKGVIYRMIDEFNNDVPYDFKNILFKYSNNTIRYPYYYYTFASDNIEVNIDNSISIANDCYSNVIREYVFYNKKHLNCIIFIGTGCYNNIFGINCYNNLFWNNCNSNSFGSDCINNSFGNNCYYNTFGNNCRSNSFAIGCINNFFGNNCSSNFLNEKCINNSFGNGCNSNTLEKVCWYNSFGENCNGNSIPAYYRCNHVGNGCNKLKINSTTGGVRQQVQNYVFANGLNREASTEMIINVERNRLYETKVAKNSSGEIKQYCEADLI